MRKPGEHVCKQQGEAGKRSLYGKNQERQKPDFCTLHLVEDWILLLFKLPIGDVGGSQPSWSCTNNHLLAGFLIVWIRPHSLFSPFIQGCDGIVQDSLDPWICDLVQVVLDFAQGKVVIQTTQKVGHSVIFSLLVLEGKVITGQLGYPSLSGSIQIG